jgi:hypothetical protein
MRLPKWRPDLPECVVRTIYLHWTGGDYRAVFPAYHFCVALDAAGRPAVYGTHDLRANACDLALEPGRLYAAHTSGRNSFACGVALAGMRDATPHDFGRFPLREDLLQTLYAVAATIAGRYAIPIDAAHIRTHAEAALEDGYFGAGDEQRWDIARLQAAPHPLDPTEAERTGDVLRAGIRAARVALERRPRTSDGNSD